MRSFTKGTTALLPLALSLFAPLAQAATTCNGHAELCDRLYSNVTFIGAHDSYAVGSSVADNQNQDVTTQLNDGIRTLQVQAHNTSDGVHLCHSSCSLLDGGLLSDYLGKVASWVSSNPNEVVTFIIVNIDNLPITSFSSAFSTAGLESKMYSPPSSPVELSAWPSLGTLIDAGTPVVAFIDNQADASSVPYLIDEFSNIWEDAYDVTDQSFGCAVNRTSGSAGSQMMLINHFLDTTYTLGGTQLFVPKKDKLNETNAETGTGSIGFHVDNCHSIWGRNPNHILLDFYDSNGNAPFNVAASLNGVSAPTNTIAATTPTASTTSGGTAKVSSSSISSGALPVLNGFVGGAVLGAGIMASVVIGAGRVLL
ncbi:hypothetical protein CI109_104664 [Kwoniella shandongensis]|uniref:Uncharacterized protein n=1 Tax=Kwoniella shandongensis TaxID=1734106 RepID=A0A5M6BXD0_9TREE|nr:uncharacterized protein CI109_004830 [Kwoniella shandongensis]KAA5526830.1 hypothetical protein CI109_004830 [Kwoniella shandongensis]